MELWYIFSGSCVFWNFEGNLSTDARGRASGTYTDDVTGLTDFLVTVGNVEAETTVVTLP